LILFIWIPLHRQFAAAAIEWFARQTLTNGTPGPGRVHHEFVTATSSAWPSKIAALRARRGIRAAGIEKRNTVSR
jgi:hypothetical protein